MLPLLVLLLISPGVAGAQTPARPACAGSRTARRRPHKPRRAPSAPRSSNRKPPGTPARPTAPGPPHPAPAAARPRPRQPPHPEPEKPAEPRKGTATGLPLPRFAALRSEEVNFRTGPGMRYPIEWVYKRRDLPVQIEREFEVWRLVRDQEGIKGWVHQATLAPRRTRRGRPAASRCCGRPPTTTPRAVAKLKPGVIVRLRGCEAGSDWCQAQIGDYRGWLKRIRDLGHLPGRGDPMSETAPRAHHDLGGVQRFLCEPIDTEPHALTDFDREVDAIRQILGAKKVMSVDELRRGIEAIPEADYLRLVLLPEMDPLDRRQPVARGVITEAELRAGAGPMLSRRARRSACATTGRRLRGPCHIRTPHYLRGRSGTVVRHLGDFPNPEDLAFARPAPRLPLYHVAFEPARDLAGWRRRARSLVETVRALAGGAA